MEFNKEQIEFIQSVISNSSMDDKSKAMALLSDLPEEFTSSDIADQVAIQNGSKGILDFIEMLS